jgi:uncharacterized protein YutE (UPF0331/DUF86 family)
MSALDRRTLAEKGAAIERHLARVEARLPGSPDELEPATDASDAVILHLWQATQIAIDLALKACLRLGLGTPTGYADAFRRLAEGRCLKPALAQRLALAVGFRNVVAHTYERLDMERIWRAASEGPADLRAFVAALASLRELAG